VKVAVRVLGPGWTRAERVALYANGSKIREARIPDGKRAGLKWAGTWTLPPFRHDTFLVAIATGPGVQELYWPIAKPYQPTSPRVDRRVIGSTGAVWLDGDGDGKWSSAWDYAQRLSRTAGADVPKLVASLGDYDEGVATQAAGLLQTRGVSVQDPALREAARQAGPHVRHGFEALAQAWRACQMARGQGPGSRSGR
jgi:hypothetical protein